VHIRLHLNTGCFIVVDSQFKRKTYSSIRLFQNICFVIEPVFEITTEIHLRWRDKLKYGVLRKTPEDREKGHFQWFSDKYSSGLWKFARKWFRVEMEWTWTIITTGKTNSCRNMKQHINFLVLCNVSPPTINQTLALYSLTLATVVSGWGR
jgi:hypothetical protein